MKRYLSILLALFIVFTLAACGAKTESSSVSASESSSEAQDKTADAVDLKQMAADYDGEIHVVIWGKDSIKEEAKSRGYNFVQMAAEYSSQFDNVTVEYVYQGGYDEVAEKIMASAAAGTLPTMFMAEESRVKGFSGVAESLNDYVPSATIANYQQGLLVTMYDDEGNLLGAPCARSLPVLYVNKELLAEAGWNGADIKTVDDMLQCAKDVHDKTGEAGMCIFWDSDCWHWESAVYADGGQILSDDGKTVTFGKDNDYIGAKYLEKVQKGLIDGYIVSPYGTPEPGDTRDDMFCSGKVGLMLVSCNSMPGRATRLAESGYTMETYVQPAGDGGIHIASGGSNWVICNTASYEEKMIAGGFIAYMAEDAQVLRISQNTGSMMITTSAVASDGGKDLLTQYPYMQSIYDSIPYLHQRVNSPYWAEMYTYGADKLAQFSLNPSTTDVKAMIDDMALKFQQIIEDNAW